jgi:hypothetical protein
MLVHHRFTLQLRLFYVPMNTPGWRQASRVKCIAQGHLEMVWVLVRFKLLGGEKEVGLSVLLRDTWKQFVFW